MEIQCTLGSKFHAYWITSGLPMNYHWLRVGTDWLIFLTGITVLERWHLYIETTYLSEWRPNACDGILNQRRFDCLLNPLSMRRSKKTSRLRVTGLCEGNSPVTGEFPAQRTSNAENASIWWRRYDDQIIVYSTMFAGVLFTNRNYLLLDHRQVITVTLLYGIYLHIDAINSTAILLNRLWNWAQISKYISLFYLYLITYTCPCP